jgi:hypothetical protein
VWEAAKAYNTEASKMNEHSDVSSKPFQLNKIEGWSAWEQKQPAASEMDSTGSAAGGGGGGGGGGGSGGAAAPSSVLHNAFDKLSRVSSDDIAGGAASGAGAGASAVVVDNRTNSTGDNAGAGTAGALKRACESGGVEEPSSKISRKFPQKSAPRTTTHTLTAGDDADGGGSINRCSDDELDVSSSSPIDAAADDLMGDSFSDAGADTLLAAAVVSRHTGADRLTDAERAAEAFELNVRCAFHYKMLPFLGC